MSVKKISPEEDIALASRIEENSARIATSLRLHEQTQNRAEALAMISSVGAAAQIDAMSHEELRAHAKNMQQLIAFLLQFTVEADANRVALGIQDNETKSTLAMKIKGLGEEIINATARKRLGALSTNSIKQEAKRKVHDLWNSLSEQERVKRGVVLRFATKTALEVKGTTVDGIRRWVAEFRKEPSKR
jgi:hypothetical protein